jgi:hypothetical protein
VTALIVLLTLAPASAIAVKLPDLPQLVKAVKSKDSVEIERIAARIGAVRLARVAERGKKDERLAALRALGVVDDSWAVLPQLARMCSDVEGDVAVAAAEASREIAEHLSPATAERDDMPRDVPARAAAELLAQAMRDSLPAEVRVPAVTAAAALRSVVKIDEPKIGKLLADRDLAVRRAAAEAAYGAPSLLALLETAVVGDTDATVAAAAAASLCRDLPATDGPTKDPLVERITKLTPAIRERFRTLAVDEALSLADRIDLLGCVRVAAKPEDQKVLDQLAKKAPESLKRRARSLGGK